MIHFDNYELKDESMESGHPVFSARVRFTSDRTCPYCGTQGLKTRTTFTRTVYDLTPDGDKATIKLTGRRYVCPKCGRQSDPYKIDSSDTFSDSFRDYVAKESLLHGADSVSRRLDIGRSTAQKEIYRYVAKAEKERKIIPPSVVIIGKVTIKKQERFAVYDAGREQIVDVFPDRESLTQSIQEWNPVKVIQMPESKAEFIMTATQEAEKLGIPSKEWKSLISKKNALAEAQTYGDQALRLYLLTYSRLEDENLDSELLKEFSALSSASYSGDPEEAYEQCLFGKWLDWAETLLDGHSGFEVERAKVLIKTEEEHFFDNLDPLESK